MYRNYDANDLVESSYNKLGSRASHGCIRLTVPDAKWIYNNCGEGVQVWIHEDGESDPELTYSLKPGAINPNTHMNYVTPTPTVKPAYDPAVPPENIRQMGNGTKGADVSVCMGMPRKKRKKQRKRFLRLCRIRHRLRVRQKCRRSFTTTARTDKPDRKYQGRSHSDLP